MDNKKTLLSHPTGNANVRAVLEGLYSANMLHSFHTSVATYPNNIFGALSKFPGCRDFMKRVFPVYLQPYTKLYPKRELGRMLASKLHLNLLLKHETGIFSIDQIIRKQDLSISKDIAQYAGAVNAVYAYENIALNTFTEAKKHAITCIYDLPIGYWRSMRRLLVEEKEKNPDWAMTLGGFRDSEAKLQRKDQELALADHIYVASSFTKKTLEEYPGNLVPIEVIPYGFPVANTDRKYVPINNRKLKLLYVGGLSQRKGIAYLFEAVKGLEKHVELTIVGRGNTDECSALQIALAQHRYIPALPHAQILDLMAAQDVFVFPSLFEGFGLVITEAMSQGTPVITTDRTCGPDIIQDGENGWLIEAGGSTPLREKLEHLLSHPHVISQLGQQALHTAKARPWESYGTELTHAIRKQL